MKNSHLLCSLIFSWIFLFETPSFAQDSLNQIWQEQIIWQKNNGKNQARTYKSLQMPVQKLKLLLEGQRKVVFDPGLLNGLASRFSGYFNATREFIDRELWLETEYKGNHSKIHLSTNADRFNLWLQKHHKKDFKYILIGHSKGGAELLYLLMKYPDLILNGIVDRTVIVQGVIGGTPIPFHASNKRRSNQGFCNRVTTTLKKIFQMPYQWYLGDGLKCLHRDSIRSSFDEIYAQLKGTVTDKEFEFISSRIFFVRSYEEPQNWSPGTRLLRVGKLGEFSNDEASDGLISLKDQYYGDLETGDPLIGTLLDPPLKADHMELLVDGWLTGLPHQLHENWNKRIAFARALFLKIFETEIEQSVSVTPMLSVERIPE